MPNVKNKVIKRLMNTEKNLKLHNKKTLIFKGFQVFFGFRPLVESEGVKL